MKTTDVVNANDIKIVYLELTYLILRIKYMQECLEKQNGYVSPKLERTLSYLEMSVKEEILK